LSPDKKRKCDLKNPHKYWVYKENTINF